jgi:hypothetical protein
MSRSPRAHGTTLLVAGLCLLLAAAAMAGPIVGAGAAQEQSAGATPDEGSNDTNTDAAAVSEERYIERVPEPGDEYFEAKAEDGSWVSYDNPRDRYRDPMVGNASGKVCVTLRNEAGDVVVGESVPSTTVTIPTPSLSWHSYADPMVVEFPLTEHYERPLDADQFGTSEDLPQGDGYLDSHCIEYHGPPDDKTIEYGQPVIEGQHADAVEVVGYVQQVHDAWETDVDPFADAVRYEETGGNWTMRTGASHGQVVIVLQLDGVDGGQSEKPAEARGDGTETATAAVTGTPTTTPTETDGRSWTTTAEETPELEQNADVESSPSGLDQSAPGFVVSVVAIVASLLAVVRRRR